MARGSGQGGEGAACAMPAAAASDGRGSTAPGPGFGPQGNRGNLGVPGRTRRPQTGWAEAAVLTRDERTQCGRDSEGRARRPRRGRWLFWGEKPLSRPSVRALRAIVPVPGTVRPRSPARGDGAALARYALRSGPSRGPPWFPRDRARCASEGALATPASRCPCRPGGWTARLWSVSVRPPASAPRAIVLLGDPRGAPYRNCCCG